MSDIFISYSSKDKEKADQLSELLASAGLSVWIDRQGIGVATSWSKEIVQALNDCKVFIVLLSSSSLVSHNVIKEVSLASEKRKKILPLELESVQLTEDFEYQLAGIQRSPMTNIDGIIRAIGKLGLEATSSPTIKLVKETDSRKSLMILPFEDLSPTADNGWFADGIVSEMISSLSNVKALRIADPQLTKEFKTYRGHLTTFAREMSIRYFVQGDVRKFGDQIKITTRLLDIETGDFLWQDTHKGTMEDIFDIQEMVATKVAGGLNIILTKEERSKLEDHGTENTEAYEYLMRSRELMHLNTREDFLQAISLLDLAIELDPLFLNAILENAMAISRFTEAYGKNQTLLTKAELLLQKAEELTPDNWQIHNTLSLLYSSDGRIEDAEREHEKHLATSDGSAASLGALGFYYFRLEDFAKAFDYYEASIKLDASDSYLPWNVLINAHLSGNNVGFNRWLEVGITAFQKELRMHPEDTFARFRLAAVYLWADPPRREDALREINMIDPEPELDSLIQFIVAKLLAELKQDERAINALRKAILKGHVINIPRMRSPNSEFAYLFGNPEFEAMMSEIEGKANV